MTQTHTYRAHLTWTGAAQGPTKSYASYSREHEVTVPDKATLTMSADPRFKGDASLLNPEDLLLVSLASCHMLTYLSWTGRKGLEVLAYEDNPEGEMTVDRGAGQFTRVTLRPRVVVAKGSDIALAATLHEDAHRDCFISRSVNFPVHAEPEIVEE